MSKFSGEGDVLRVDLDEEDWVEVRRSVPWGTLLTLDGSAGPSDVAGARLVAGVQVLKIGIAAWGGPGFTDEAGAVVPIDDAALLRLKAEVARRLIDLVVENNESLRGPKETAASASTDS